MDSQFEKEGADKVYSIAQNNTAALIIANLAACMWAIANDRKAWFFADKDGNVHKTLQDASGDGIIAQNSVIIANSDGQATSNANFQFDATNAILKLPFPFTLAFGDQSTNKSMRIRITSDGFFFEKRESGAWVEKGAITA